MFKRAHPLPLRRRLRELVWPSMGWHRTGHYVLNRLLRLKDSHYSITAGLATGAAVSFTPIPGTHIIQATGLTWAMRGNVIAALIGTLVGNPWTLPLMWWLGYRFGKVMFGVLGYPVRSMPHHLSLHRMLDEFSLHPLDLVLPWLVGGYTLALLSWPVFYGLFHWLVVHFRSRRVSWKQRRLHRVARKLTAPDRPKTDAPA